MERREQQIEIEDVKFDDLERLCEIYSDAFNETAPMIRQWWSIIDNPNIQYRVAKLDGKIMGVASIIIIDKIINSG